MQGIDKRDLAIVSLSILLVLTVFEVAFYSGIHSLNLRVYNYCYNSINMKLMSLISFTAGGGLILAVSVMLIIDVYRDKRLSRTSIGVISSLIVSMIIVFILKITLQIPRPSSGVSNPENIIGLILNVDHYSFPSGHVARAASVASYLSLKTKRKGIIPLLYSWVVLVMISRLVLGVHWLTDVIASIFVGLFSASLVYDLEDSLVSGWERLCRILARSPGPEQGI